MAPDAARLAQIPSRLLAWYDAARRDLPWRRTAEPYRIWLAEVMLQQTRVETVVPYYERFLKRFPTLRRLAAAPLDDVLAVWAGLGYYSRARSLHAAARQVVAEHGGQIPSDPKLLRALPGIGRYTAGAILSIAFGQRASIVDGNVVRILCRLCAIAANPKATPTQKRLWGLAEAMIPKDRPGDFNQAMMDFGATLCAPKAPACGVCPLADLCEAFRKGRQLDLPRLPKRKATPHFDVGIGLVWRRGKLLIAKRRPDAMLGGLWEFPGGKQRDGEPLEETVRREVREEVGLEVTVGLHFLSCRHAYSHFRITLHAYHCRSPRGRPRPLASDAVCWAAVGDLGAYPFPSGSAKIIRELCAHPEFADPRRR